MKKFVWVLYIGGSVVALTTLVGISWCLDEVFGFSTEYAVILGFVGAILSLMLWNWAAGLWLRFKYKKHMIKELAVPDKEKEN